MNSTTLIGGETFDVLVRLFDVIEVRRDQPGWYGVSATSAVGLEDSAVRAIESITAEIWTDPEHRAPEALRADAFVELAQRISGERHPVGAT